MGVKRAMRHLVFPLFFVPSAGVSVSDAPVDEPGRPDLRGVQDVAGVDYHPEVADPASSRPAPVRPLYSRWSVSTSHGRGIA